MGFTEAVKTCFSKYVTFSGRARRSEYWYFVLAISIVSIVLTLIDGGEGVLSLLWSLGTLLPSLAVGVRRLHDIGRSGWWLLIILVPLIGFVVLIYFAIKDSEPGENRFGPNPKGAFSAEVFD